MNLEELKKAEEALKKQLQDNIELQRAINLKTWELESGLSLGASVGYRNRDKVISGIIKEVVYDSAHHIHYLHVFPCKPNGELSKKHNIVFNKHIIK